MDTLERLSRQLKEPEWLAESRRRAWDAHAALPWPHPSDEVWRRTDVSLLDPARGFSPREPQRRQAVSTTDEAIQRLIRPLGQERVLARCDGAWLTPPTLPGVWVAELAEAARERAEGVRRIVEADGLTDAERKLETLNEAFHHDGVFLRVPPGSAGAQPIRLVHLWSGRAREAVFPLTVITVGAGADATLIDEYLSLGPADASEAHLVNARVELVLEPGATLRYVRLQRWSHAAREFVLQRVRLERDASLTMANLALGASLSKAHLLVRLAGERASSRLSGFVFGHARQHIDQHTVQDHQAARTTSDLEFRAALQDQGRMIYTGLIRIAKAAAHTEAFQANHNLMLSRLARAETIPMLEILADDVQCKHGASTGPIDEEQRFYLMSRGLDSRQAERLIVMGFVESVIQQIPFEPLQRRLREEIEGGLHADG